MTAHHMLSGIDVKSCFNFVVCSCIDVRERGGEKERGEKERQPTKTRNTLQEKI
jgi:hypothetical protein